MDPFSVTTGVVGLLAIIAQVTEAVNFYINAMNDRKQDIEDLYRELILLRNVLTQLQDFAASEKAKDASFDSNSLLGTAMKDCTRRLERVGDKLKVPNGDRLSKAIAKLRWPFEQDEIQKLLTSLQRFIQTFSFALSVQGLTVLAKTSEFAEAALKENQSAVQRMLEMGKQYGIPTAEQEKVSYQLEQIMSLLPTLGEQAVEIKEMSQQLRMAEEREQARQKADILEWLVPTVKLQKHVKTQRQRVSNTCAWFLDSQAFENWQNLSDPAYDVICTGNPGVGKTVLASFVFDHLRTRFKGQEAIVVNYYCSYFEDNTHIIDHFVRSLLRQVCQALDRLPTPVVEFHQRTRHDVEDYLWLQELQSVLKRVLSTCDHVFLVIDALDEVEDVRQRNALLSVLKDTRSVNDRVRILATTRPHLPDLHTRFVLPTIINISAEPADVERMLIRKLEERPDIDLFDDAVLRHEVVTNLCSGSGGNFLLPTLQLDHILEQVTKADVRLALDNLSQTLDDAFKTSLERISARPPARRNLAFRTMMWISHVMRPLDMTELQHALAMRDSEHGRDLDHDNIVPARIILESCSGLIQMDEGIVTFVHFSLEEYLASKASSVLTESVGNSSLQIVRASLTYLLQPSLKKLSFMNTDNFTRAIGDFPFLRYAAYTWGIHARRVNAEAYADLAIALFDSGMSLITISRVREMDFPYARKWETEAASWAYSGGAGISVAAGFGLAGLLEILLAKCKDTSVINRCRNRYGNTALQDAAGWGHTRVCKMLVDYGADLLNKNKAGATAFYQAVAFGRLGVVQELLKHHRGQLDIRCRDGWTALHKAADLGNQNMVSFLLSSGALIAIQNDADMTPLHLAANRGHTSVVQSLVQAGADVNATCWKTKFTPLCLASTCGHPEIVRYLLDHGASVNNKGADSWTPLFRASRGGHIDCVRVLLEGSADILYTDYHKNICLHLAARSGKLSVVRALLDHNPALRPQLLAKKDAQRRNAQQIALATAHIDMYKYLRDLQHSIDAEAGTQIELYDPSLPLALAIEAQQLEDVRAILDGNPELLHRPDASEQLPIHLAFIECAAQIAEFLLATGASINSQGYHSWQPLHIAASVGSLEMTQLALSHGPDVNALTGTLQTPLLKASSTNSIPVIRCLLEAGADPCAQNSKSMTCLHVAASKGFIDIIRELLQPEWNAQHLIHMKDKNNHLPRYWAERSGHHETVRFLRLQEKLIDNIDSISLSATRTPGDMSRTNTNVSSNSLPLASTPSRTPSNFLESEDMLAQMVLELESD